jgi:hypothetical protein
LYKEDFEGFNELLKEMTKYIIDEKGLEVISERHQKDYVKEDKQPKPETNDESKENFTDVDFDDI